MAIPARADIDGSSYQAANPFASSEIRDWIFCFKGIREFFSVRAVATIGFCPFQEAEFDEFLVSVGLSVESISQNTSHLILGHSGWSEAELLDLLRLRSGEELRVYSQEMFLAYAMTWRDPLEGGKQLLDEFSGGHAGLEYLTNVGFDWPSKRVVPNHGLAVASSSSIWGPEIGLLGAMGYRVGKNGVLSDTRRWAILDKVFNAELPIGKFSPDYLAQWGEPRSPGRLLKMANAIATFCRNGQGKQRTDMSKAVRDWSVDLDYLRRTYYTPLGFRFQWPSTKV